MVDREEIKQAVVEAVEADDDRGFVQTIDLAINLKDTDLSVPKNRVDAEVQLPNGRGKDAKVGVFCTAEMAEKINDVADLIVTPEEIEDLADDKRQARKLVNGMDFFLAEAPLMPNIGRFLGVVLGPRGKMPNPVPPGSDPTEQIQTLKEMVKVRSRDKYTFHCRAGTEDQSPEELADNIASILRRVQQNLEYGEMNIKSVYVKTTMGPSVRIQ